MSWSTPHFQVRLWTLRKSYAPSQALIFIYTILKSRPPNGVLTLVNSLSTKRHRTMHHVNTDETMVSRIRQCAVGTHSPGTAIRFHSSKKIPMGQSRKAITSWGDVIGAASRWSSSRVIYYSTSAWKRRRDTAKLKGKKAFPSRAYRNTNLSSPCRYTIFAPPPRWTAKTVE